MNTFETTCTVRKFTKIWSISPCVVLWEGLEKTEKILSRWWDGWRNDYCFSSNWNMQQTVKLTLCFNMVCLAKGNQKLQKNSGIFGSQYVTRVHFKLLLRLKSSSQSNANKKMSMCDLVLAANKWAHSEINHKVDTYMFFKRKGNIYSPRFSEFHWRSSLHWLTRFCPFSLEVTEFGGWNYSNQT